MSTTRRLRIFLAIPQSGTRVAVGSRTWYRNFYESLVAIGHDVHLFSVSLDDCFEHADMPQWLQDHRGALTAALWREFQELQRAQPFDLFFGYLCNDFVDYGVLDDIRGCGVVTCNFGCNNTHQFYLVDEISKHVDVAVYAERAAAPKFAAIGARAVHMQMAANPRLYRSYPGSLDFDVTFVGQRYADRAEFIVHLARNGVDVRVWGPGWELGAPGSEASGIGRKLQRLWGVAARRGPLSAARFLASYAADRVRQRQLGRYLVGHTGDPVDDDQMVRLYSRSRVSLGFSTVYDGGLPGGARDRHVRLRDFEAPMSGAFYLLEYTPEIEEYYRIGEEIECFTSRAELLDKTRYYLRNGERRESIRRAGQKRALADHTWERRFRALFSELGLG